MPETEEENLDDEQLLAEAELEAAQAAAEGEGGGAGAGVAAGAAPAADVALKHDAGTDSEGGTPGPVGDRASEDDVSPAARAMLKGPSPISLVFLTTPFESLS
jgi:hypothetical protein